MSTSTERVTALDLLYRTLSTTIRGGRPNEPPFEIVDGYVKLQVVCGYHQLGNSARAAEIEVAAHAQLEGARVDPIHAWLIDAFAALVRGSGELPAALHERLDGFDRVTRYKVDMFREASWIVGGGTVDAVGHFGRMGRPEQDLEAHTAAFLARVDRVFALAEETPELADAYIETSLQISPHSIDPAVVEPVLDRVVPRIERMTERRGLAYARAVAMACAAPARLPELIQRVAPFLEADTWELDEIMALLSESLSPNHRSELAALWRRVPDDVHHRTEYLIGLLRHGVMPNRDDVLRAVASSDFAAQKLRAVLLDTLLARPFPDRFAGLWAGELFGTATDELSTNSHFSYNVVYVVDRLVRGVLDP